MRVEWGTTKRIDLPASKWLNTPDQRWVGQWPMRTRFWNPCHREWYNAFLWRDRNSVCVHMCELVCAPASFLLALILQKMVSQRGQSQLGPDWPFAGQWCNPQETTVLINEAFYLRLLLILCVGLSAWICARASLLIPSCVGRQRCYC